MSKIDLYVPRSLELQQAPPPDRSPKVEAAVERAWTGLQGATPDLFDGLIAAVTQLSWSVEGRLQVAWTFDSYRYYAVRFAANCVVPPAKSLYVSMLLRTDADRVVFGLMSNHTASPRQWQLPGGNVEVPSEGQPLTEATLRRDACRELVEELGVLLDPADIALWGVKSGGAFGDVGIIYRNLMPLPWNQIQAKFASHVSQSRRKLEFLQIANVGHISELLGDSSCEVVDYAPAVLAELSAPADQGPVE